MRYQTAIHFRNSVTSIIVRPDELQEILRADEGPLEVIGWTDRWNRDQFTLHIRKCEDIICVSFHQLTPNPLNHREWVTPSVADAKEES